MVRTYKLKPVDLNIAIEILEMCNLRCRYCYVAAGIMGNNIMKLEDYMKIIENIISIKNKYNRIGITFTGGEPTLHPDLIDMVRKAKDIGIDRIALVTNGTLMNKRFLDNLIDAGLEWIAVSIDSYLAEDNDYLRGKGVYEKVIETLKILSQYENIYKSLSVTLTSKNISKDNAEGLVKLGKKYNVDAIVFNMIMLEGNLIENINDLMPSYDEYLKFIKFLETELITEYFGDIDIIVGEPWAGLFDPVMPFGLTKIMKTVIPNTRMCSAGLTSLGVFSNGDLTPCLMLREKQFIIGNLIKEKLIDLIDNELLRKIRGNSKVICGLCEYSNYCGGCYARSLQVFKNAFYADPLCPRNIKYLSPVIKEKLKIK
jgi:radical SAM additional 4Fe4S-binding domain